MSDVIEHTRSTLTRVRTNGDQLLVHRTFFDDANLDQNSRIRNSGMLDKAKLGLHDNEDVRAVVSCPSVEQWNLFKRKHPEVYSRLMAKNEPERMKGARELSILHPDWVVYSRL
jgi:hypothetical protein